MNVVIIEDEIIASQILVKSLNEVRPKFNILTVLQTIEESIDWFKNNPMPDLVFMDIHLADGSSFNIFDKVNIKCPIIFITAYNEYALEAFEVNGIDYLLKPVGKTRLEKAIAKYESLKSDTNIDITAIINNLTESFNEKKNQVKKHFLITYKDKLIPLSIEDIAYFQSELKIARVATYKGDTYTLDYSLDEIMKNINKDDFFRVNRQYIVAHKAIKDLSIWFAGKLVVNLSVSAPEKIYVSKAKVSEFKTWFTRGY